MSQTPKKKQNTKRRLTVEMMESRLMLSISPTGPNPLRDLTDVEFVPPPSEGAEQIDMLDFSDIASQFNSTHATEQIEYVAPVRALPPEDAGALNLEDPSSFLSTSTDSDSQDSFSVAYHLTDEYTPIRWDTSTPTHESTPPVVVVTVPFEGTSGEETALFGNETEPFIDVRETFDSDQSREAADGDFTLFYTHPLSENLQTDPPLKPEDIFRDFVKDSHYELGYDLASILNYDVMFSVDGLWGVNPESSDVMVAMILDAKPIDGFDMASYIDDRFADTFVNDFYINDTYSAWTLAMTPTYDDSRGIFTDYASNTWETQVPPTARVFNPDALRIMASTLYQDLYYNSSSSTSDQDDFDSQYLATMDSYTNVLSHLLTNSSSENGQYVESTVLLDSGGGDGTTVELDIDELALLESQGDLDSADIEIEGRMIASPEVLIVDNQTNAEEGGMIDFTDAMNWAQTPVAATAEGIVQASVQQDHQIAFEGLYGRGQTFELATAEEEDASKPDDPNLQEVSAALLKELNNMPLKSNAQENIDKTNTTLPTAHEMALREMNNEMDYASMLPSDALAWATFAFATQTATTRHPNDRKKKK